MRRLLSVFATLVLMGAAVLPSVGTVSADGSTGINGDWEVNSSFTTVNQTLNSIACPSSTNCYAAGVINQYTSQSQGIIQATTNGGQTWTTQTLPSGTTGLYGVACPTSSTCYAVGHTYASLNSGGVIVGTTNGGQTWTTQTLPANTNNLNSIACTSVSVCYVGGDQFTSNGGYSLLDVTKNGGSTWTQQELPFQIGVNGISCPTASDCYLGGTYSNDPADAVTHDAGQTWSVYRSSLNSGQGLGISCPTANTCYEAGDYTNDSAAVTKSTDGGQTWSFQTTPGIFVGTAITCPSSEICYALGGTRFNTTAIAATDNGGQSWQLQTTPQSSSTGSKINSLNSISCMSTGTCYSAGNGDASSSDSTSRATVLVGPVNVMPSALPNATILNSYTQTLSAKGGASPYSTWAIASGSLPFGMSLSSSGVISGTPILPLPATFTVTTSDSSVPTLVATKTYVLNVGL